LHNPNASLYLAVLYFIISVVLLVLPGSDLPRENWLSAIYFDKWVHIGMFALLVFLWCRVLSKRNYEARKLNTVFVQIALAAIVYGTIMELIQGLFIPGRSGDVSDIIADTVGAWGGYYFSRWRFIKK
jgi:VanZ family protein